MTQFQVCHVSCDRCGLEDDSPNSALPDRWGRVKPPWLPEGVRSPESAGGDLCPACVASFWRWYKRKDAIDANAAEQKGRHSDEAA